MYKLITLDMDDTLLNDNKVVSQGCIEAMKKANACGKYVVIATGRAISELIDYKDAFAYVRYVIAESGALLYDWKNQKVIAKDCFTAKEVETIYELTKKEDIMIQWFINGQAYVYDHQLYRMKDYEMGGYQELFE